MGYLTGTGLMVLPPRHQSDAFLVPRFSMMAEDEVRCSLPALTQSGEEVGWENRRTERERSEARTT